MRFFAAGYVIDSIEIAIIFTKQINFRVLLSRVSGGSGLLLQANVPPKIGYLKWNKRKEQDFVSVYGVDLTLKGYHKLE